MARQSGARRSGAQRSNAPRHGAPRLPAPPAGSDLPPAERRRRGRFLPRIGRIFDVAPATAAALLSQPRCQSVRINTLSARPATAIAADLAALDATGAGLQPIAWCPGAFELHGDKRLLSDSALFRDGDVYIQNAASLVPALALAPRPGDRVLDLCAAPGGKAAHLAALAGNALDLHLNDAMPARLRLLREITATLGVRVAAATGHPAQYADKVLTGPFDRILLDAQCSGEGMLDLRHPTALRYWTIDRIETLSRLQQRMLMAAWKLLRPGGRLVYATCTFAPEENEGPVDHLLRHRPDAVVRPIDLAVPGRRPGLAGWDGRRYHAGLQDAMRLTPAPHLEGFFICCLEKQAPDAAGRAGAPAVRAPSPPAPTAGDAGPDG